MILEQESGLAERRLWFVRRNGEVKGPFLSKQITRNILLGRLRPDDELSPDEENWRAVAKHRELYPDVMQEAPVDESKLEVAKVQADERVQNQRRKKQAMAKERRRAKDRRGDESDVMLVHREHRNKLDEANKNRIRRPRLPSLSIALVAITVIGFTYVFNPERQTVLSDCTAAPSEGVNWSNCSFINLNVEKQNLASAVLTDTTLNEANFLGVNLSGANMSYADIAESDLSYANLEGGRLIGANLKHSDLRYANLKNADLSYADLSNALLAGANIENARFDNAIWTDGQVCGKGSIGTCRLLTE